MTQKQLEKGIMAVVVAFIAAIVLLSSAHGQNPGSLIPTPKMQFFDNNGVTLAGGKVYTYAAGTTTPLASCTDVSCGVSNTNPVILDSAGRASIWLNNLAYKLTLKTSADVTIWTVDNVAGYCALSGCLMTGNLSVTAAIGPAIQSISTTGGGVSVITLQSGTKAVTADSQSTSGGTVGLYALSHSASGIAIQAYNQNASGQLYSGLNSAGVERFAVANNGAITSSSTITGTGLIGTSLALNGGTALTTTNQSGTGNLCLTTSCALTTPTATNVTLSTGVAADGSGFKHKRVTTGSILASATTTVGATNWGTAFADNNYTMTCMVEDVSGANLQIVNILSHSASAFTVNVKNNDGGSAHTGTIDCIAVHD